MIKSKNVARTALLSSLAILLGYVESLFPPPVPIVGIKLGLANTVVILELYSGSKGRAFLIALLKVILCAALFGSPISFIYSLSGAVISFIVMIAAKRTGWFSLVGVSSLGGVFHNFAQLMCAYFFIGKGALLHMPVLFVTGAMCGALTGSAAHLILKRGGGHFGKE